MGAHVAARAPLRRVGGQATSCLFKRASSIGSELGQRTTVETELVTHADRPNESAEPPPEGTRLGLDLTPQCQLSLPNPSPAARQLSDKVRMANGDATVLRCGEISPWRPFPGSIYLLRVEARRGSPELDCVPGGMGCAGSALDTCG